MKTRLIWTVQYYYYSVPAVWKGLRECGRGLEWGQRCSRGYNEWDEGSHGAYWGLQRARGQLSHTDSHTVIRTPTHHCITQGTWAEGIHVSVCGCTCSLSYTPLNSRIMVCSNMRVMRALGSDWSRPNQQCRLAPSRHLGQVGEISIVNSNNYCSDAYSCPRYYTAIIVLVFYFLWSSINVCAVVFF